MTILTAGCFDVLHVGHINLILFCRQLAGANGIVWVSLDTDQKIQSDKGSERPIFLRDDRKRAIELLTLFGNRVVDQIVAHNDNEHLLRNIYNVKPDYIVAGEEYKGRVVGAELAEVIYFKKHEGFSSTEIIKACQKK